MERKSNVDRVEIVKVIRVESIFGKGVDGDVVRQIVEYHSLKGALIVRIDSWAGGEDERRSL